MPFSLNPQEELQGTNLDVYSRSEEEIAAPFEDKESAVYQSGLRLVSVKWTLTEDPYNVKWIAAKSKGMEQSAPNVRIENYSKSSVNYDFTTPVLKPLLRP